MSPALTGRETTLAILALKEPPPPSIEPRPHGQGDTHPRRQGETSWLRTPLQLSPALTGRETKWYETGSTRDMFRLQLSPALTGRETREQRHRTDSDGTCTSIEPRPHGQGDAILKPLPPSTVLLQLSPALTGRETARVSYSMSTASTTPFARGSVLPPPSPHPPSPSKQVSASCSSAWRTTEAKPPQTMNH